MLNSNSGAAVVIIAALTAIAINILSTPWTYTLASDGVYLGVFPLAYLAIAIVLIATTLVDRRRLQPLVEGDRISTTGLLKIPVFIGSALVFAFFHESIGFVAATTLLALTTTIAMGVRSLTALIVFSITSAVLLFITFSVVGSAIVAWPQI